MSLQAGGRKREGRTTVLTMDVKEGGNRGPKEGEGRVTRFPYKPFLAEWKEGCEVQAGRNVYRVKREGGKKLLGKKKEGKKKGVKKRNRRHRLIEKKKGGKRTGRRCPSEIGKKRKEGTKTPKGEGEGGKMKRRVCLEFSSWLRSRRRRTRAVQLWGSCEKREESKRFRRTGERAGLVYSKRHGGERRGKTCPTIDRLFGRGGGKEKKQGGRKGREEVALSPKEPGRKKKRGEGARPRNRLFYKKKEAQRTSNISSFLLLGKKKKGGGEVVTVFL